MQIIGCLGCVFVFLSMLHREDANAFLKRKQHRRETRPREREAARGRVRRGNSPLRRALQGSSISDIQKSPSSIYTLYRRCWPFAALTATSDHAFAFRLGISPITHTRRSRKFAMQVRTVAAELAAACVGYIARSGTRSIIKRVVNSSS